MNKFILVLYIITDNCTYGALGTFSTGKAWFKVPGVIKRNAFTLKFASRRINNDKKFIKKYIKNLTK